MIILDIKINKKDFIKNSKLKNSKYIKSRSDLLISENCSFHYCNKIFLNVYKNNQKPSKLRPFF